MPGILVLWVLFKAPILYLFSLMSSLVDSFVLLAPLPGADAGWVGRRQRSEGDGDSRCCLPSQREAVLLLKLTKNDFKNIFLDFFFHAYGDSLK